MTDNQIQDLINEFKDVEQFMHSDSNVFQLDGILWEFTRTILPKDLKDILWSRLGRSSWSQLWCCLGTHLQDKLQEE